MGRSILQAVRLTEVKNAYLEFLNALNALGVRYAVLHDWQALAEATITDVDVIVRASDLRQLEAYLCAHYRVFTMFHYEASGFGFVLAPKDCGVASAFIADISTDYRWHGRIFFTAEELLQNRRQWNGFWVVGPREEFAYLLVKKIYEKGFIPAHQKTRLEELTEELGPGADSIGRRLFGKVDGSRVIEWISNKQWAEVEARLRQLQRSLRWQVLKRDSCNSLRYWLPEIRRRWQRWRYPTGLAVLLFTPSGMEKTKVAWLLKEIAPPIFRRAVVFRGLPNFPSRPEDHLSVAAPPDNLLSLGQLSWFRFAYSLAAHSLRFLFKERPLLARSTLILFDCDSDHLLAHSFGGRGGDRTRAIRVAHPLIPRLDVLFIRRFTGPLFPPGLGRVTAEDLRRVPAGCRQFSLKRTCTAVLDGCQSVEELAVNAREILAECLQKRYLERRPIWFGGRASQGHPG